jgi:hypothetical protein
MAVLPDVVGVARCSLTWSDGVSDFGSRIFTGGIDPDITSADLVTLATQISDAYGANFPPWVAESFSLVEVEAMNLTSPESAVGFWRGSIPGTDSSNPLPSNVSMDLDLEIGVRYRGGHPVTHLPPSSSGNLGTARAWNDALVTAMDTAGEDFRTAVNAITPGTGPPVTWLVLRGYRSGALPEAVTQWPVLSVGLRKYLGTMRRRVRSLR